MRSGTDFVEDPIIEGKRVHILNSCLVTHDLHDMDAYARLASSVAGVLLVAAWGEAPL